MAYADLDPAVTSLPLSRLGRKPCSLPRHRKLCQPADFTSTLKTGRRLSGRFIQLVVKPAPQLARLGLAIAKRVIGLANARNTVKRVARESFRHVRHNLPQLDIVVLARAQPKGQPLADSAQLRLEFDRLFAQLMHPKRSPSAPPKETAS